MKYDILKSIGLGDLDITYIFIGMLAFIIILMILIIVQMVKLNKLNKKYKKFMSGKNAKNLETDIMALFEDNKLIKVSVDKNRKDIHTLYKRFENAFQKIGLVKYDAFAQMGGQLSFSLALLDENNNGFILNSVHSADGCYSYTKEIKQGTCDVFLGDEEKKALDMAVGESKES
ncbi:MAG: DUF4446 family protein [Lachnospiraceae bacterium]|nr:DUF4446 family protein [Lachnospiraceae bacterium]